MIKRKGKELFQMQYLKTKHYFNGTYSYNVIGTIIVMIDVMII